MSPRSPALARACSLSDLRAGPFCVSQVALETLLSFRRAGADLILTYYAKQASKWLMEDGI